jgi:hypothetical protein
MADGIRPTEAFLAPIRLKITTDLETRLGTGLLVSVATPPKDTIYLVTIKSLLDNARKIEAGILRPQNPNITNALILVLIKDGNKIPEGLEWITKAEPGSPVVALNFTPFLKKLPKGMEPITFSKDLTLPENEFILRILKLTVIGYPDPPLENIALPIMIPTQNLHVLFEPGPGSLSRLPHGGLLGSPVFTIASDSDAQLVGLVGSPLRTHQPVIPMAEVWEVFQFPTPYAPTFTETEELLTRIENSASIPHLISILKSYFYFPELSTSVGRFYTDLEAYLSRIPADAKVLMKHREQATAAFYMLAKKHGLPIEISALPLRGGFARYTKIIEDPMFQDEFFKSTAKSYEVLIENKLRQAQQQLKFGDDTLRLATKYAQTYPSQSVYSIAISLIYAARFLENINYTADEISSAFGITKPNLHVRLRAKFTPRLEATIESFASRLEMGNHEVTNALNILPILEQNPQFQILEVPVKAAVALNAAMQLLGRNPAFVLDTLAKMAKIDGSLLEKLTHL